MRRAIVLSAAVLLAGLAALPVEAAAQQSRGVAVEANRSLPGIEIDLELSLRAQDSRQARILASTGEVVRVGDEVVVCFEVSRSGWISVWSKDAEGEFARIYPNSYSHPGGGIPRAERLAAEERLCIGDDDRFRIVVRRPLGAAEVYLHWTPSEALQMAPEDYPVIGRKAARSASNFASSWISYRVQE